MQSKWIQSGNMFSLGEASAQLDKLPPAVYRIDYNEMMDVLYLRQTSDAFELPPKLYGSEHKFVDRVIKTYHKTKGNLGLLLNGVKGTGKTVTGKLLANRLKLPILVVANNYDKLPTFINTIQQDVLIFFDEYEKIYSDYDDSLLTVMDGILDTTYRRVFLLTTNNDWVNENLMQRPGRIRYKKAFGDLTFPQIREIIDDLLINKKYAKAIEDFCSTLEIVTVDIVRTLVEEVNIHKEPPLDFADIFNVQRADNQFNVFRITGEGLGDEHIEYAKVNVTPGKITPKAEGATLHINNRVQGKITKVFEDGSFQVLDPYKGGVPLRYRLEKVPYIHQSYLV